MEKWEAIKAKLKLDAKPCGRTFEHVCTCQPPLGQPVPESTDTESTPGSGLCVEQVVPTH